MSLVRRVVVILLLAMACFYFYHAAFSGGQTTLPEMRASPDVWSYESFEAFGRGVALLFGAVLAGFNIRPGWPNVRSRWNLFLAGAILVALFIPPAWRVIEIDACLDAGASWDYELERCSSGA